MRRGFLVFSLFVLGGFAALAQSQAANWVGTWAASPVGSVVNAGQAGPGNTTYRNIVHTSLGGSAVRVQLTNEFGTDPLTVGAAHVAISAGGGSIQPNSDHALTFNGRADGRDSSGSVCAQRSSDDAGGSAVGFSGERLRA
ncbi:MAG: hypothetical protein WAK33_20645 [Silvibacterium sp.]